MTDTQLRVTYKGGEPQKIKFGRGLMGETTSLAHINESTAIVAFDNARSTDFERACLELPFIQEVDNATE